MTDKSNQSAAIPVEVRRKIHEWVIGTFSTAVPGVPIDLIEKVTKSALTIYRVEVDITSITTSVQRQTVYLAVNTRSGAAPEIDQDSVVFFD